jgi:HSP20 family protein
MANQDMARYTPRNPMPLSEAINQLMRDAFTTPFGTGGMTQTFGMNLFETNDSYIVQVPLPGVQPDQLSITARENVVTLQGTTEIPAPEGARNLYAGAIRGQFREMVQLPGDVDADKASASYNNGVLTLTLPKAASARERAIKVTQVGGQTQGGGQGQMQGY